MFNKGDFFFKVDIKSGYHHINILEEIQNFLCFSWTVGGVTRYFKFIVLVFGLASAPFVFTKVVKVLIKHWRKMGIRIFAFVDDFFEGLRKFHNTELVAHIVKTDLCRSGFVVNPKKSRWVPTQKDSHLGFIVDLREEILSVTPARIQKLNKLLNLASKDLHLSARKIASLVGSIISMGLGIGPVARFITRHYTPT